MKSRHAWFRDPVLWCCLAIGAVFLFVRLGQMLLWQDEAETAVLARNILRFGFPRAFDGLNLVFDPQGYGANYAWLYHPWASLYLTAAFFKLFGATTWAARAPYALLGWLGILLTYLLARGVSRRLSVRRWSMVSLVVCVPFFLYMRQCRYYAPSLTLGLAWLLAYRCWVEDRPWSTSLLVMAGALLFHTNYGVAVPFGAAAVLDWWIGYRHRMPWRRPLAVLLAIGLLTVPWFWYLQGWRHATAQPSWHHVRQHAEFYLRMTNKYFLPLAFWAAVLIYRRWRHHRWLWNASALQIDHSVLRLGALTIGVTLLFVLLPEQRHVRYLVPLIPLWLIGQALLLDDWIRHRRWVGVAVAVLVLGTNLFSGARLRVPLTDFFYELGHDYHGPNEAIVQYLNTHAKPGEQVKTPYDERVIIFYTRLAVEPPNAIGPSNPFARETYPKWLVPRAGRLRQDFWQTPYGRRIRREYEEIPLAAVDLLWDNLPDPNEHHFRTVTDGPEVVIYRKRSNFPGES